MSNLIKAKAAKQDGKVVIWETHPSHPTGEIFISGDGATHDVAETLEVQKRLKDGSLAKVFVPSETKPPIDEEPVETKKVRK